jgi:hypothetical protein
VAGGFISRTAAVSAAQLLALFYTFSYFETVQTRPILELKSSVFIYRQVVSPCF